MPSQSSKNKVLSKQKKLRTAILSTINEHYPISSSQLRYRINTVNKNFTGYQEDYITNFITHHLHDEISIYSNIYDGSKLEVNESGITLFCPKNMPANVNSTDRLVRSRSSLSRRQQQSNVNGTDINGFVKILSTLKVKNSSPISWSKIKTHYNRTTGRSLTLEEFNKIADTSNLSRKAIIETKFADILTPSDDKCDNVIISNVTGSGDISSNKENSTPTRVINNLGSGDDYSSLQKPLEYVKKHHDNILNELKFYEKEIDIRGGSQVSLVDLGVQFGKFTSTKSYIFDSITQNTENSRDIMITMLSSKFKLEFVNGGDIYLSAKDLDFDRMMEPGEDSSAINKPCSLEHEKEIEHNLEAVVAGGDILLDSSENDNEEENKENKGEEINNTYSTMSYIEHLSAIGTDDPGDALEIFICSRLQNLIEEGMESIPICNLDQIVNEIFEMKVDPVREYGMNWEGIADKFVKRNLFYYTPDKKALVLKDPTTPEVYEEHIKIPSDYSCSSSSDGGDTIVARDNYEQFGDASTPSDYDSPGDGDFMTDDNTEADTTLVPGESENVKQKQFEEMSTEMVNAFENKGDERNNLINNTLVTLENDKEIKIDITKEDDKTENESDVVDVNDITVDESKPLIKEGETSSEKPNHEDEDKERLCDGSTNKSALETCPIVNDPDEGRKSKKKSKKCCCCTIC